MLKVAELAATTVLRVVDYLQERSEKRRPKLDPPLTTLPIDEVVAKAAAERKAKRDAR